MSKAAKLYDIRGMAEERKKIETAVILNTPILLIGETGTGKTSLIKSIAEDNKKIVTRINLNGQTSKDEFVGKYILEGKEMKWIDGPLIQAMRRGEWILVDEINAALPEILFVLHSVLDDDRHVLLSEKDNELVKAHADFRFFATMNPVDEYAGTKELNKAFLSRFGMVLNIGFVEMSEEISIITSRTGITQAQAKELVSFAYETRKMKDKQEIFTCASTRDLINAALLIAKKYVSSEALSVVYLNKLSKDEVKEILDKKLITLKGISTPKYYTEKEVEKLLEKAQKTKTEIIEEYQKNLFKKIAESKAEDVAISMSSEDIEKMVVPF